MSDVDNNEIPVPTRLSALETGLEKILSMLSTAAPIASLIPGAAPIVAAAEAVGEVADDIMHDVDGTEKIDPAALAAHGISTSTGDATLDMRLAQVEAFAHAALPLLLGIAKHFGLDLEPIKAAMPEPKGVAPESVGG